MSTFVTKTKFNQSAKKAETHLAQTAFDIVAGMRATGDLTKHSGLSADFLSNESFTSTNAIAAGKAMGDIQTSLESFANQLAAANTGKKLTPQQMEAAAFALASAQNPKASLLRQGNRVAYATNGPFDVYLADNSGVAPADLGKRSLEAYDTKPNDEMLNFTAAFAISTATQNRFTEMFFKTVNLSPDQYAVEMEIPLISVHPEVRYELEKRLTDFNRRNIVNAEIDHTILKNDTLKIVPVHRAQVVDMFVDPALVAPYGVILESGEAIQTAPLRVNHKSTLWRVASTDAMLAKGNPDQTDALDVGAILKSVILDIGGEAIRFDTTNMPLNQFIEAGQGQTRLMQLNFATDDATVSDQTTQFDGTPSAVLTAFQGPAALTAWLSFSVRGDINLQDSAYELIAGSVTVSGLQNKAKENLDINDPGQAAIKALFATAKVIGFEADISKVNSNLRELGQLADFTTYRQVYGVALGSPLAVQRPIANGDSQDALHAAALSYMCRVRQTNLGITQLQSEVETLRHYAKRTNIIGRQPEILGISSYLLEPTLVELEIDLEKEVTTTAQHQRYSDITSILTDACTITAYRLWQRSNWQAAANLLEGTEAAHPVVKLGTDMVLAQYLITTGDMRTVGPDFTFEKASTPDNRVYDKIYIALGYPSQNPGVPHPLDHGMMIQKPEVVAALNLSRGSHSRELIVHPSFRHITLCPILGVITVKNLDKALAKKATLQVDVREFPSAPPGP